MASKEVYRGICFMLKRKTGTTAVEIQYKYNLTSKDTVLYILQAQKEFNLVKTGNKLRIPKDQNNQNVRRLRR